MPIQKLLLLITSLVFLASPALAASSQATGDEELLPFQIIAKGREGIGARDPHTEVITSKREWKRLWKRIHPYSSHRPDLPKVKFKKEMVIAIFRGSLGPPEFSVQGVVKTDEQLRIRTEMDAGGRNCFFFPAIYYPFICITTDKLSKQYRDNTSIFAEVRLSDCSPSPIALVTNINPADWSKDPLQIEAAEFYSDFRHNGLRIRAIYTGGLGRDSFQLAVSESFEGSDPAQVEAVLSYTSPGPSRYVKSTHDLTFDLTPLRVAYQQRFQRQSGSS